MHWNVWSSRRYGQVKSSSTCGISLHGTNRKSTLRTSQNCSGMGRVLALHAAGEPAPVVDIRCDPEASAAFLDRVQIEQVVFNLVRNAIEAMSSGVRRVLTLSTKLTTDRMTEISVADTGPGVSADIRARLFEPFVTTKESGLGIGLSICRVIVEAHGGKLTAEDNPAGGAIFRFTIPN